MAKFKEQARNDAQRTRQAAAETDPYVLLYRATKTDRQPAKDALIEEATRRAIEAEERSAGNHHMSRNRRKKA